MALKMVLFFLGFPLKTAPRWGTRAIFCYEFGQFDHLVQQANKSNGRLFQDPHAKKASQTHLTHFLMGTDEALTTDFDLGLSQNRGSCLPLDHPKKGTRRKRHTHAPFGGTVLRVLVTVWVPCIASLVFNSWNLGFLLTQPQRVLRMGSNEVGRKLNGLWSIWRAVGPANFRFQPEALSGSFICPHPECSTVANKYKMWCGKHQSK